MKRAWMVAVVMAAGVRLHAGDARPTADFRVPVCLDYERGGDLTAVSLSETIASMMFRKIGVTLIWVNSKSCPPDGIRISLTGHTPATLHPGALAYATPYEGTHIRIFRDRIEATRPALVPHLLAHVLVHETIHILQGVSRHSESGVMKAHWDDPDFARMLRTELPIFPEDIELVHLGVEKRARLAAAQGREPKPAEAGFAML